MFLRRQAWRWALGAACPLAILAMFIYVASLPTEPDEGVNIGAGVLLLWLVLSAALLLLALLIEGLRLMRRPRFMDEGRA